MRREDGGAVIWGDAGKGKEVLKEVNGVRQIVSDELPPNPHSRYGILGIQTEVTHAGRYDGRTRPHPN